MKPEESEIIRADGVDVEVRVESSSSRARGRAGKGLSEARQIKDRCVPMPDPPPLEERKAPVLNPPPQAARPAPKAPPETTKPIPYEPVEERPEVAAGISLADFSERLAGIRRQTADIRSEVETKRVRKPVLRALGTLLKGKKP